MAKETYLKTESKTSGENYGMERRFGFGNIKRKNKQPYGIKASEEG